MSNHTGFYPRLAVEATGTSVVFHAGAALLLRTADKIGLTSGLSESLAPWRKPLAVHDPGKTVLDLAVAVALGGDCLADIAVLREQPAVFGPVASDPTVSRTITELARRARSARCARSIRRPPQRGRPRGHWPAPQHPITTPMPGRRWSSTSMQPW